MTEVRGPVTQPDGSLFSGVLTLELQTGGSDPIQGAPFPYQVNNGELALYLSPTSDQSQGTYYLAQYVSRDNRITWTDMWLVPVSTAPVNWSDIRLPFSQGSSSPQSAPLPISQVIGLSGALSSLAHSVDNVSSTVASYGSDVGNLNSIATSVSNLSAGLASTNKTTLSLSASLNAISAKLDALINQMAASPAFVDREVPKGSINGINLVFSLLFAPTPSSSLQLFRNGLLLQLSTDYSVTAAVVTFVSPALAPQPGDTLTASYRH